MERHLEHYLADWLAKPGRKPLVLRGARQVGKTWLVRELARRKKKQLVELNFEKDPSAKQYFTSNHPTEILKEISLGINRKVEPGKSILFLDEIQAAGRLIAKLRWFAEDMPSLPVIAAGSLLEFTLSEHDFSMPVGRVGFLHVEPMGFSEFLLAHGQEVLHSRLREFSPDTKTSPTLHEKATRWFQRYLMVGGMPAIIQKDVDGESPESIRTGQDDLAATYRGDFSKYRRKIDTEILDAILLSTAMLLGKKFVYARVGNGAKQNQAKRGLTLLSQAGVCHLVKFSSANGLPLGGEVKEKFRKAILGDLGLFHALTKLPAQPYFPRWDRLNPQIRGQIIEQAVGQLLRLLGPFSGDGPELYYWQREGGRPGEIDYLLTVGGSIIPVELKAGAAGAMKSLHQFMYDKKLDLALRFDGNPPTQFDVDVKTTQGNPVHYKLISLPHYLAGISEVCSRWII